MGVFARFRRRSAGASPEEPATHPQPADVAGGGHDDDQANDRRPEAAAVDIPKQQSAEEAADSEAGEGARP